MTRLVYIAIVAAALAGCASSASKNEAPAAGSQKVGLVGQAARIVDSLIAHDAKTFDEVQLRLRRLNEAGVPLSNYSLAKAQCWLDTARTQHSENDRTGYVEDSLAESVRISQALEADRNTKAGHETPLVARSSRLRDDLWTQLAGFRAREATLACTARTVACAEVRLVRAGHAEQQTGWRQATPHIQMAEDAIRRANAEAASCNPAAAASARAPAFAAAAAAAPAQTVTVTVTKETFVILADTLFRFDKAGREDILPGGLQRLADVAQRLKRYPQIQSISITGHTDRLGSDDYNDQLSQARADTVKAYFESQGIKAASTSAKGVGKREPVSRDCSDKLAREALVQCLQPDRRVTIEITGNAR
jgi:OOP family OmpA-OmpF porin